MTPGETMARDALAAWEKAAGALTTSMVRDPRNLELGANMLQLGLMWKRTADQFVGSLIAMSLKGPGTGNG